MSESSYVFISGLPVGTTRERELTRAEALSHAAWMSHQRRPYVANTGKTGKVIVLKRSQQSSKSKNAPSKSRPEGRTARKDASSAAASTYARPEPLSILNKGNSDPFQSAAANVTPRANQIIAFIRDVFLPANYMTDSKAWIHRIAMQDEWTSSLFALQSECCAQGFLLAFLSCLVRMSPQNAYAQDHLELKAEATSALRRQIAKRKNDDLEVINSVMLLFGAETFLGNHRDAAIHGKMLQTLLKDMAQKEGGSTSIDQGLITRLLWFDFQLSQSHFTATIVDGKWATEMLKPTFDLLDDAVDNVTPWLRNNLDDSITSKSMRSYFIRYRQAIWLWLSPHDLTFLGADGVTTSHWLLGRIYLAVSSLLNQYLHLRDFHMPRKLRNSLTTKRHVRLPKNAEVASWGTKSFLILGFLLSLGLFGSECQIDRGSKQSLFPGLSRVLEDLRGVSGALMGSSIFDQNDLNAPLSTTTKRPKDDRFLPTEVSQDACLWALFLGAWQEQKQSKSYPDPSRAWFNQKFRLVARRMGLSSWPWIRSRMERFAYFDGVEPDPSEWVTALLGENEIAAQTEH